MRHAFRDWFRRRRVARHTALHGDRYDYHGISVDVPERAGLGVRSALLRGKYERDEAAMILKHLPPDLPVVELGGSLGVVSALIRSQLAPSVRHLVFEANPDLVDICRANAGRTADGVCEVLNAAVFYDGPVASLAVHADIHSSALQRAGTSGRIVEVPAISLAELWTRLGEPPAYSVVSDIEGGELPIFMRDATALAGARIVIIEIHPKAYEAEGSSEAAFLLACGDAGFRIVDRQADVVVLSRR